MTAYTFQGEQILAPITIRSNQPVFSSDSVSLKRQQVQASAQRWELDFNVAVTDPAQFFVQTITANQGSNIGKVTMTMPQIYNKKERSFSDNDNAHTVTGSVSVSSTVATGANTVPVQATGQNGNQFKNGAFIKFSNHSKIYMLLTTVTVAGNIASLVIYPNLVSSVTTSHTLNYLDNGDVQITCWRDVTNLNGITFTDGVLSDPGVVRLVEAV